MRQNTFFKKKSPFHSRKRRQLYILLLLVFLLAGILLFGAAPANAQQPAREKYYTSVTIQPGDTLWSLAKRYAPQYSDLREYVDQLIRINQLGSSQKLRSGQSLIIVYYK